MKNDHLTLRLPRDLARDLARRAKERARPKSELVREAVASYLEPPAGSPVRALTAGELARLWPRLPRLDADEAAGFADDVGAARRGLPPVRGAWE